MELSEAKIPEILAELTRRGTAFAGLANLVKWDDNSKGSFVRFAIDMFDEDGELRLTESPFKGCMEGVQDGQTFFLTATMAPDSPLTEEKPEEPEEKPKQAWSGMKPQQQAGMLCNKPEFRAYLYSKFFLEPCDIDTKQLLKNLIVIDSLKDLETDDKALKMFNEILAGYFSFQESPPLESYEDR